MIEKSPPILAVIFRLTTIIPRRVIFLTTYEQTGSSHKNLYLRTKLSKSDLQEAIQKLVRIKSLRSDIPSNNPYILKTAIIVNLPPLQNQRDQISALLVCESFKFKLEKNQADFFKEVYDGIDKSLYHNMILSLSDGLYLYHDGKSKVVRLLFSQVFLLWEHMLECSVKYFIGLIAHKFTGQRCFFQELYSS